MRYEGYKKLAASTVAASDGRYVVQGRATEILEGAWEPGRVVVLEFPTAVPATEWSGSDACGEAKWARHESVESNMIVV